MRPSLPMASWTVLTPKAERALTASSGARVMLVWTTPSSCIVAPFDGVSPALPLEQGVKARIDGTCVVFVDGAEFGLVEAGGVDVACRVVEMVARPRIDVPDRADHFGGKEDVLRGDDFQQEVDSGLVVHAGVEEDISQQVLFQRGLPQGHGKPTEAPPVVGHSASPMGNDELQGGEVLEQVPLDELHESGGVRIEVV